MQQSRHDLLSSSIPNAIVIKELYKKKLNDLFHIAERGKSSFGWMFSSRDTKENVERACEEINQIIENEYSPSVKRIIKAAESAQSIDEEAILADYVSNRDNYWNILLKVVLLTITHLTMHI